MRGSIAVVLFLSACSQFDSADLEDSMADAGDAGSSPPVSGVPMRSMSLSMGGHGYVTQGLVTNVVVDVRKELFDAPLRITLTGLPSGATASEVLILAGESKATVPVAIPTSTPQGRINVFMTATAEDGFTQTTATELYVRGRPGTIDPRFANAGFFDFSADVIGTVPVLAAAGERVVVAQGSPLVELASFTSKEKFSPDFAGGTGVARIGSFDAEALAPSADGAIFVGSGAPTRFARITPSGSVDPVYDATGATAKVGVGFTPRVGVVQPDGKVIFAGTQPSSAWSATRLFPGGAVDTAFGADGLVTTTAWQRDTNDTLYLTGMFVRPSGQILIAGRVRSGDFFNRLSRDFYAASQLTPAGVLDSTFGASGTMRLFPAVEAANQVLPARVPALREDGTLVLFGATWTPPGLATVLVGANGVGTVNRWEAPRSVEGSTEAADGSVFYATSNPPGPVRYTLVRKVLPDGKVDATFGVGGEASLLRADRPFIAFGIEPMVVVGPYVYVVFSWAFDGTSRERWSVARLWN